MKYIKKQIPVEAVIFEGFERKESRFSKLFSGDTVCFSEIPTWLAAELGEKVKLFSENLIIYLLKHWKEECISSPVTTLSEELRANFTGATQKFLKKHMKKWRGNHDLLLQN